MKHFRCDSYPGANATIADVIALADEYRGAASMLLANCQRQNALSRAPSVLCSIHAIELYLNAFLRHRGEPPEKIRGYLHDLAIRSNLVAKLNLRKRTVVHLIRMTEKREYLIARYGPEAIGDFSEITRLQASLNEIAAKVTLQVLGIAPNRPFQL